MNCHKCAFRTKYSCSRWLTGYYSVSIYNVKVVSSLHTLFCKCYSKGISHMYTQASLLYLRYIWKHKSRCLVLIETVNCQKPLHNCLNRVIGGWGHWLSGFIGEWGVIKWVGSVAGLRGGSLTEWIIGEWGSLIEWGHWLNQSFKNGTLVNGSFKNGTLVNDSFKNGTLVNGDHHWMSYWLNGGHWWMEVLD